MDPGNKGREKKKTPLKKSITIPPTENQTKNKTTTAITVITTTTVTTATAKQSSASSTTKKNKEEKSEAMDINLKRRRDSGDSLTEEDEKKHPKKHPKNQHKKNKYIPNRKYPTCLILRRKK